MKLSEVKFSWKAYTHLWDNIFHWAWFETQDHFEFGRYYICYCLFQGITRQI